MQSRSDNHGRGSDHQEREPGGEGRVAPEVASGDDDGARRDWTVLCPNCRAATKVALRQTQATRAAVARVRALVRKGRRRGRR